MTRKRRKASGPRRIIARNIKRLRRARGWTQSKLAAESGYTRAAISIIEAEGRAVSQPGLIAIAAALGVSPDHLKGKAS